MCTLSKDDTQSPINPVAATTPQDKYKPHPSGLPATPHPCSRAATAKVTQSYALCEGFVSSLYFPSSEPHTAGAEDVLTEGKSDQHMTLG